MLKFTNQQIYELAENIMLSLKNLNVYIPAKANFLLQKNIQTLTFLASEIEKSRINIIKHYGILNEETHTYTVPDIKLCEANQELEELLAYEQEVDIKVCSINDFGNAEFTPAQMQAIMFMIEE